ncbi:hypothetical protein JHK84_043289 [Glycine max]|nr:hypothetical protein JHK84_043289 [Glycine max]
MASSSDERYVWPWTGIVANIFGKPKHEPVECDSMYWLRKFEQYKLEEAYVLHCAEDPTGYVVLEFGTEWTGFTQMMKLDTDFLVDNHGKKDYYESRKMGYSSGLFGWRAQAEYYNSEGLVGNFLRQKAELKTTSMVAQDSLNEKTETLDHLYGEIGSVNKKISDMESKYIEYYMSLDRMMKEIEKKRDLLHQTRAEDDHVNCAPVLKSMVMRGREITYKAMEKNKKLQQEIDTMNDELDRWCQQLIEQEKSTIQQRRKFEEEKKSQMESLILATEKQMKARSDVLSLLEKQEMEKKAVSDALLKLEKEMGNEQNLNLEIAELEEQLKVLKCVNSEEANHENKRKIEIEEIEEKLEDMIFDMSVKDDENQALKKKVQEAKTELEDARQQIIKLLAVGIVLSQLMLSVQKLIECICLTIQELPRFLKGVTKIQIKKFGEVSGRSFKKVCMNRYKNNKKASSESVKLCAKWQKEILDSTWHPFKIVEVERKEIQEVIDENDPKLLSLKNDLGEEAYVAMVTALKELHEYHNSDDAKNTHNSSEKQVIPKIWDPQNGRRATVTEALNVGNGVGIACMKEETKRIKGKEKKIQMRKMEKEKIEGENAEGENTTTEKTQENVERVMDKIHTIINIKWN